MWGRCTQKYPWEELRRRYRLPQPGRNLGPRYNICPTDPVDVIVPMRWQLIPPRWKKPAAGERKILSKRIPRRIRRELKIADIGTETQSQAGTDRHHHHVIRGKNRHTKPADEIR